MQIRASSVRIRFLSCKNWKLRYLFNVPPAPKGWCLSGEAPTHLYSDQDLYSSNYFSRWRSKNTETLPSSRYQCPLFPVPSWAIDDDWWILPGNEYNHQNQCWLSNLTLFLLQQVVENCQWACATLKNNWTFKKLHLILSWGTLFIIFDPTRIFYSMRFLVNSDLVNYQFDVFWINGSRILLHTRKCLYKTNGASFCVEWNGLFCPIRRITVCPSPANPVFYRQRAACTRARTVHRPCYSLACLSFRCRSRKEKWHQKDAGRKQKGKLRLKYDNLIPIIVFVKALVLVVTQEALTSSAFMLTFGIFSPTASTSPSSSQKQNVRWRHEQRRKWQGQWGRPKDIRRRTPTGKFHSPFPTKRAS